MFKDPLVADLPQTLVLFPALHFYTLQDSSRAAVVQLARPFLEKWRSRLKSQIRLIPWFAKDSMRRCVLLSLLLAHGLAVRQMNQIKSNDGIEEEEDWGSSNFLQSTETPLALFSNCGKALCNGRKFLDFGNVMAIFDKCVGSPGKWKNEAGKIIKPEQTSAKFTLNDGDYICRESCSVLVPQDQGGGRRWETKTVPSLLTSVLQRLVRCRAPKAAAVLLSALRLLGLEVNIIHQNCLICAAERSGNWRLATDFLGSAARQRVCPDEISYNTVLSAQESSWKAAAAALEALQNSSCEASATSYNSLLSACEKCSSWSEALSVLSQMLGLSVALDAFSESAGITTLNKAYFPENGIMEYAAGSELAASPVSQGCKMSVTVAVGLLSGRTTFVEAGVEEEVGLLSRRAQAALGIGKGQLVDSFGHILDPCARIKDAGVQDGDWLTMHLSRVQACATGLVFAAILGDGSVITWGSGCPREFFGDGSVFTCSTAVEADSSVVQDQLKDVEHIQAAGAAFAAIRAEGSVVTWGDSSCGGDSSAKQDQLKNVQQIQASANAFAAILADGSVVTWGDPAWGGASGTVQDQLKNVQQIQAARRAFAAILGEGSVVTWGGDAASGGDSSAVQDRLKNVQRIQASNEAFAAILGDGSVVTWGDAASGGDSSAIQNRLKNVQQIQASNEAFAAILGDGFVVTWGDATSGGDSRAVQDQLKNVQQIQAAHYAFAAILGDGSVVTWGVAASGGDSSAVQDRLKNVQQIQASNEAFAAILGDGSVVTWGDAASGGDSRAVQDRLKNVQHIQASCAAFAAILADGSVVTWGDDAVGGDSSAVQEQLKTVQQIQASGRAFAAILGDASVVTWGDILAVEGQLIAKHWEEALLRFGFADAGARSVVTFGAALTACERGRQEGGQKDQKMLEAEREEVLCRICQDSSGKLVRACGCKGTLAYVHPECLMQWRAYSPKAAAMCELCNCPYTLPGPLGCGQTSALTLTLVALLMIWMSLARDVLVVNGSLLPAAKHCNVGEFTPPWRRALVSLFEAADLDQDGAMSLEEMRALANRTGEKVSDAVLELALKLADHNENLGEASRCEDLKIYNLSHVLRHEEGDVRGLSWALSFVASALATREARQLLKLSPLMHLQWRHVALQGLQWFRASPLLEVLHKFMGIGLTEYAWLDHPEPAILSGLLILALILLLHSWQCTGAIAAFTFAAWPCALAVDSESPRPRQTGPPPTDSFASRSATEQQPCASKRPPEASVMRCLLRLLITGTLAAVALLTKRRYVAGAVAVAPPVTAMLLLIDVKTATEQGRPKATKVHILSAVAGHRRFTAEVSDAPKLHTGTASRESNSDEDARWLSALQLLTKLPATSLQGNVVTYSAALAACADAVQWCAACQLFWDMANASVEANTVVFGAITGAFAAADWRLAISMLSTMVKEAVRINTVVLLAALDACASAGKTDTIIALSTEMADAGVRIDAETCSAIVAACESRPRRAAMLLDTAGKDGLQQLQSSGR
eukprot:s1287_g7.t4